MSIAVRVRNVFQRIVGATPIKGRLELLEECFRTGLPPAFRMGLEYLITGSRDNIADSAAAEAEDRRAAIAAEGERKVPIWYSPKPGSAGCEIDGCVKPSPGKVLEFSMSKIAATGRDEKWGTFLHLLIRGFQCERGIELGTCAGVSAMYLSAAPSITQLITVEGSTELVKIARISLAERKHVSVVNAPFDEALNIYAEPRAQLFDFAYIDGHHEKVATIHYFNRLAPCLKNGALVIFDDISWSHDMREAWGILSLRPEFSHAIDLGAVGVCQISTNNSAHSAPRKWDLQRITGAYSIGDPPGWKE